MLIRKAYKFRLNVTQKQSGSLFRFTGCCRFLWNKCWYINKTRVNNKQPIMRYQEMDFWSKLWKQSEEYGFLKECQSQLLQQKLKDLDKAFMDCFDKKQTNKKFPRPKKKGWSDSFRYPQGFKINGNNIFLPKLGWFRFRQSRAIEGEVKNVTVSYYAGYWYVSIQTEIEIAQTKHPSSSIIGIDVGIARFAMLSKGNRKSQSVFECESCGYTNNADVVGAINVCRAGHAHLACGDIGSISTQAQEPSKKVA